MREIKYLVSGYLAILCGFKYLFYFSKTFNQQSQVEICDKVTINGIESYNTNYNSNKSNNHILSLNENR